MKSECEGCMRYTICSSYIFTEEVGFGKKVNLCPDCGKIWKRLGLVE